MKYRRAAQTFLPLKPHWFHVLLSLAAGEQHGYAIMQEVLDRTDGKIRLWPATLYGTLKRLMEDKLVADTEEKKNELETYIYELRNKLDDQYAEFASEDEKAKIRSKLDACEVSFYRLVWLSWGT